MNNPSTRHPYQGAIQIFQYNWTFYAAALLVVTIGILLLKTIKLPLWIQVGFGAAMLATAFWAITSLAVSHYVYDRSGLYEFQWLTAVFSQPPPAWINIHAGLDETSHLLKARFPSSQEQILDIYDPGQMTELAIKRARDLTATTLPAIKSAYQNLPVAEQSCEAIFVIFTAHELRAETARVAFFAELYRALQPQGQVIVVEHLRDWHNFLAFGPGAWHFLSHSTWRRTIQAAQFILTKEIKLTPFVSAFCLSKP